MREPAKLGNAVRRRTGLASRDPSAGQTGPLSRTVLRLLRVVVSASTQGEVAVVFDEAWRELLTGDIVLAKSAADVSGPEAWTEVGVVIRPRDVGAVGVRRPVVFTADGFLGEVGSTVRAYGNERLAIVEGQASGDPSLLVHVREAVVSVQATAMDSAGAVVLNQFRREQSTPVEAVDPHVGFQRLIDVTGYRQLGGELGMRHCQVDNCGAELPCLLHS